MNNNKSDHMHVHTNFDKALLYLKLVLLDIVPVVVRNARETDGPEAKW